MNKHKLARRLYYYVYSLLPSKRLEASEEPIDVVIPVLQKDLKILPLCLQGIRRCVVNKVKDIYIVAPNDERIADFCRANNLIFVDESTVFDFTVKDLKLIIDNTNRNRSGWLFQQLIKLSGRIGTCDSYLCVDADHVLIRPHVFITKTGTTVFYKSKEYHKPYFDNLTRLFGWRDFSFLSYVDHKMCFNKRVLIELHKALENTADGKRWTQVILDNYDRANDSDFSEFQLYGHFVKNKVERPWRAHGLRYNKLKTYDELCRHYAFMYAALTFPDYRN